MFECVYRLHVYARLNSLTTKLSPRVKQHHNACTHRVFCLIARYKGQGTNNDHHHQQISSGVLRLRLAMHKGSLAKIIMEVPGRARSRYHEPGLGSGFIERAWAVKSCPCSALLLGGPRRARLPDATVAP